MEEELKEDEIIEEELPSVKLTPEEKNKVINWMPIVQLMIMIVLMIVVIIWAVKLDASVEKYNGLVNYVNDICYCAEPYFPK